MSNRYHNMKIVDQGLEAFLKKGAPKYMIDKLVNVGKEMREEIYNDPNIPTYTRNLLNSIGVVVFEGSKVRYMTQGLKTTNPPHVQSAGKAATGDYGVPIYNIIGAQYFKRAMAQEKVYAAAAGGKSCHIIIFASVPYAAYVNEYGAAQEGHRWGNEETASGGRGQMFFNNLVGWRLWGKLGREFFRGNKSFISDNYKITQ